MLISKPILFFVKIYNKIRLKIAFRVLRDIDELMRKNGWSRQRRREFWRRIARYEKDREGFIEMLNK